MTTNWTLLLNTKQDRSTVSSFASGDISGKEFYSGFVNTSSGGVVRGLLRNYGVDQSRTLARKALSRRSGV